VQRRCFLGSVLGGAAAFGASGLLRCSSGQPSSSSEQTEGAEVERLPFEGESGPYGVAQGEGLDGRLYTDLSQLDADNLIVPNEAFYIRTRYPSLLDPDAPWSLRVGGLVEQELTLPLAELLALERDQGVYLLECSGNFRARGFGLLSAASWHGVGLLQLLERVRPLPRAARILISGSDAHAAASSNSVTGASWIISPEQLARTGAFLATRMNGVPLPLDHGSPLRLFNPGWYGCSCIKWVQSLDWVADEEPSTSQMIEYSARTHQIGQPALARDYAAPEIQQAAMPIRVEKWRSEAGLRYRVAGIVWGGSQPISQLGLSFDGGIQFESVSLAGNVTQNRSWSLWSHDWAPAAPGSYTLVCRVQAPDVPMRRLDSQYYARHITLDEV
jgi:DMSO/TMAO reductase YedYZ molybdopterin-dependent catalytic subunit